MKFPSKKIDSAFGFIAEYSAIVAKAHRDIDSEAFEQACDLLEEAYINRRRVFVCGNGGSTAIANHMVCDHGKLIATETNLKPCVISLSHPTEMITAIGNDIGFDEIFSYQLQNLAQEKDVLVVISGSGSSENVVKAIKVASAMGVKTIALTAFKGGQCKELADLSLHVDVQNYGIAEDVHQSIMQMMAQFIRMRNMSADKVADCLF
ncbi:MAG: SIS domain-containing protein [Alphaproteobacteria bacterium]|nr:SIS domain-containing protein [Alphaproteobacteria bacterium]